MPSIWLRPSTRKPRVGIPSRPLGKRITGLGRRRGQLHRRGPYGGGSRPRAPTRHHQSSEPGMDAQSWITPDYARRGVVFDSDRSRLKNTAVVASRRAGPRRLEISGAGKRRSDFFIITAACGRGRGTGRLQYIAINHAPVQERRNGIIARCRLVVRLVPVQCEASQASHTNSSAGSEEPPPHRRSAGRKRWWSGGLTTTDLYYKCRTSQGRIGTRLQRISNRDRPRERVDLEVTRRQDRWRGGR